MRSVHVFTFISLVALGAACAAESDDETAGPPGTPAVGGESGSYATGGSAGSPWDPSGGSAGEESDTGGTGGKKGKDGGKDKDGSAGEGGGGTGALGGTGGIGGIGGNNTGGFGGLIKIDAGNLGGFGGFVPSGGGNGGFGGIIIQPQPDLDVEIKSASTLLVPFPLIGNASTTTYSVELTNNLSTAQTITTIDADITFTLGGSSIVLPMLVSPTYHIVKGNFSKTVDYTGATPATLPLSSAFCNGTAKIVIKFQYESGATQTETKVGFPIDC